MGFDHVIPQFLKRIYKEEFPFKVYGGSPTRAFCYVSDAIKATQLAMDSEKTNNKILHVGNDNEEISILDLSHLMLELNGKKVEVIEYDAPEGSVERRCPDISFLKQLGFTPGVKLEEGIKLTAEWYRNFF